MREARLEGLGPARSLAKRTRVCGLAALRGSDDRRISPCRPARTPDAHNLSNHRRRSRRSGAGRDIPGSREFVLVERGMSSRTAGWSEALLSSQGSQKLPIPSLADLTSCALDGKDAQSADVHCERCNCYFVGIEPLRGLGPCLAALGALEVTRVLCTMQRRQSDRSMTKDVGGESLPFSPCLGDERVLRFPESASR
jgi:hypothetical protein